VNTQPYPFVTDLVFRAKHHSIEALSVSPIFGLWSIEKLDTNTVISQFQAELEGNSLTAAEKLKLGFLIGYSWPMHHHPKTEQLLLLAKAQINDSNIVESMLLWGKLASFYFRSNQLTRALEELTLALNWAKFRVKSKDIIPFMHWTTMIFVRLNRPQYVASLANTMLKFTNAIEEPHYYQSSEYLLAISLFEEGKLSQSQQLLEQACEKTQSGTSRLCGWDQIGSTHKLAQVAFEQSNIKYAEKLNAQSMELNQSDNHELLNARCQLLQYKLECARDSNNSASALADELEHYQDYTNDDVDFKLDKEITQIRVNRQAEKKQVSLTTSPDYGHEAEIAKLQQSLQQYIHSTMYSPEQT